MVLMTFKNKRKLTLSVCTMLFLSTLCNYEIDLRKYHLIRPNRIKCRLLQILKYKKVIDDLKLKVQVKPVYIYLSV